jgi:hypothetical protein
MGLLDQLWDDTVAGPRPDTGLSRLRKQFGRPAAVKINGECALGKKSRLCHCQCQFAALLPPKLTGSWGSCMSCRSGRGGCGIVRPAVSGDRRRGDAGEGDAQHHDQAPRWVPGVAEERGQHAAGISCRVHAAHFAVLRCR